MKNSEKCEIKMVEFYKERKNQNDYYYESDKPEIIK